MELEQRRGEDRAATARYVAGALEGLYAGEPTVSPHVGGRTEGLRRLRVFNTADYAARRNNVGADSGASALSPYVRHGCVSLPEAKRDAVGKIGADRAHKWIQELAWRQFWQLQYERLGDRIFEDLEEPKVPLGGGAELPEDVAAARTGLNCMDTALRRLSDTGYLYNHERMWFAAYLVHHRKVSWKVGAQLFYRHLLDGDPASNTLSWQWVASTFSHKPYFFNRENVARFSRDPDTGDTLCTHCPAARGESVCPFDDSYEVLERRLFGKSVTSSDNGYAPRGERGRPRRPRGDMAARRPPFRR